MALESVSQRARIRALLTSVDEPCWVVATDGRVLVRNTPARELLASEGGGAARAGGLGAPHWILDFAAGHSATMPLGARVRYIALDGQNVVFAAIPADAKTRRYDFGALGLDDVLAETAEHLLREFSETEIALLLGRSVLMVHNLVVTVFRQLGVKNRAELTDFTTRVRRPSQHLASVYPSVRPMTILETQPAVSSVMESGSSPYRARRSM